MEEKYIEELKNGKKIRLKFKSPIYDNCEDGGWWSEELWIYDN